MLSSKRVRQHNMSDSRWKLKDKLTQYRGLINLYKRDKKITEFDRSVQKQKLDKKLSNLRKIIRKDREILRNVMVGDREMLQNTLATNKPIWLSQQNSNPLQVIEYLEQENFAKRKQLDKLRCAVNAKKHRLLQLKLEETHHQETVVENVESVKLRVKCQVLVQQVEEAILKQKAASSVQKTYQSIVQLMKKDAQFFNVIIDSLQEDFENQAYCLIRTTQMGQLAMEYMDDRKHEFETLEKQIKGDLSCRQKTLINTRNNVKTSHNSLKWQLKTDVKTNPSDVNLGRTPIKKKLSEVALENDVERLEKVLHYLKRHFQVNSYKSIFPCMVEQKKQNGRLKELAVMNETKLDMLLNKKNHAESVCLTLNDTMQDEDEEYEKNKIYLHEKIEEQKQLRQEYIDKIANCANMMFDITTALHGLHQMCKTITISGEQELSSFTIQTQSQDKEEYMKLLLRSLNKKLDKLLVEDTTNISDCPKNRALAVYQNYILSALTRNKATGNVLPKVISIEYPNFERDVITRLQIKKASKSLVDLHKSLDLPRPDTNQKTQGFLQLTSNT